MMGMIIVLAIFAVESVGGIDELVPRSRRSTRRAGVEGSRLDFLPPWNSGWMPLIALCVYLAVNWWASWYPGAEPGGGGYVAQRIFSAKTNVTACSPRSGSTSLTTRCALAVDPHGSRHVVLYPEFKDTESGYILIFMDRKFSRCISAVS